MTEDRAACFLRQVTFFSIFTTMGSGSVLWLIVQVAILMLILQGVKLQRVMVKGVTIRNSKSTGKREAPIYIEHAENLPWDGSYKFASTHCMFGYTPLVNGFNMYKRIENIIPVPDDDDVIISGEVFILHLPECGRSDKLYRMADTNFRDGIRVGPDPVNEAQSWSGRSGKALDVMHDLTPDKWAVKRRGKAAINDTQNVCSKPFGAEVEERLKIIEDLRLFYRKKPRHPKCELAELPVHLGLLGPVTNELDEHLKRDSENNQLSAFLIEPFLPFNRLTSKEQAENGKIDENIASGVVPHQLSNNHTMPESKKQSSFAFLGQHDGVKANLTELNEKSAGTLAYSITVACKALHHVMLNKSDKFSEGTQEIEGSAGISNLGQTCYANSALQYLHCVPELKTILDGYTARGRSIWTDAKDYNLTAALQDIIKELDGSIKAVSPLNFMKALGERNSTFKEKEGHLYRQQDVVECLDVLISTLSETIAMEQRSTSDPIRALFGIEIMNRAQPAEASQHVGKKLVYYLDCPITDDTDSLQEGLENALKIEGGSLSDLPRYLTIQLQRVNPGESGQGKKILSEVHYPLQLDVTNLCSQELKHTLQSNKGPGQPHELVETKSGIFDLIAVIAHEGADATSGHYGTFVKQDNNKWIRFNDEEKHIVTEDDVLTFTGAGASTKTACACLYKARGVNRVLDPSSS